ncbi:MAG TPA: TIGR03862 family flavoprotein, partial [bacterium]|nr:TIGR03862 family flavoprotein [bacterium]
MSQDSIKIAVVGSGPAGLMCAQVLSHDNSFRVTVFDQYRMFGRKLLIAGKTGLNITNTLSSEAVLQNLTGPHEHFQNVFSSFSKQDWIAFVNSLGVHTYEGSSHRVLIKETATDLLESWITSLKNAGILFTNTHQFIDFSIKENKIDLAFLTTTEANFDAVCLALGGQSYAETDPVWIDRFKEKQISISPLLPSNVGYCVDWSKAFLLEAEGQPLKNINLKTSKGSLRGELTITQYGLEGTPIYQLGAVGIAHLDLKPDLTKKDLVTKCQKNPKKLSPLRLLVKNLNLSPVAEALLYHHTSPEQKSDLSQMIGLIKNFPVTLTAPRPLAEAISTAGGVCFENLNEGLMLKRFPGVFLAGEMLDWDAPTGGFLIQT